MAIEVFNRHEIKYMLTDEQYHKIRPELEEHMEVDSHSRNGDFYTICNVYYDTPDHSIVRKSIEKPCYKEKLRLRSYGLAGPNDMVFLEIKKKYNGFVNKRRTYLCLSEAYEYIRTKVRPEPKPYMNQQVLNEIDYMLKRYELQPMLYLSYDRNAMNGIEEDGFRITFDTNLRTRRSEVGLDCENYGDMLIPQGLWLMEAKTEHTMPLWFAKILSGYKLYPISYSKYGTEYKKNILGMQFTIEE